LNPDTTIQWLLDSDPAIRWQVQRDLLGADESVWAQERQRLPSEGWCARLLGLQDADGLWNRSLYNGKWLSTTYTLYLLKILGLPPDNRQAAAGCERLLESGLYQDREIRFSRNQAVQDLGVTGLVLSLCCCHGLDRRRTAGSKTLRAIVEYLADQQNPDGSWLPYRSEGAADYKFETTLLILEGMLQYRKRFPEHLIYIDLETRGQEFLLKHHLYLREGKPIKAQWTSFSFPAYWFYDVLTALDYFRSCSKIKDSRLLAGINLVQEKRSTEGAWKSGRKHSGKTWFDMEKPRQPSRWNTLRALRVLGWWNG